MTQFLKSLFSLIILFTLSFNLSANAKDIKLSENSNKFVVTSKSLSEFSFVHYLSEINTLNVKKDSYEFVKLIVEGYSNNAKNGNAELPVIQKLINVPFGADIEVSISKKEQIIISLSDYGIDNLIFPSQPSLSKSENAEDVPFYFNEDYYDLNDFHSNELVSTKLLGKMRGQQLARLSLSPFKYNPTTNDLVITTKLEVNVNFKNIDFESHSSNISKYYSPHFNHLFKSSINYIPVQDKDLITTYPVKYVIVSDPSFQPALQPLIDWKTKKGFNVIEAYTNDPLVGNTTSSIHAFIKDMYDNATLADPAPTYLLIVGDDAQVPSFSGNSGSHLSDMYYCEFDGNGDFYPEMYFGRMSATNSGEVEIQVNKTLTYEQYTFPDPSYLDEIVLVAGVDAQMAPTYGNGQINYGTDNYFNIAHGLTIHNYLYGSGTPITSDMSQASPAIIADISNGVGFANYTAHCGPSGWSDPSFELSDINGLQNYDKYGVMIGNCCQSNKFDVAECFGEGLLRASNKGAVAYIGGSNNTYWNEDFWWGVGNGSISANPTYSGTGLATYDCLMHENGEIQDDWFITASQMMYSGNLAVTEAGGSEEYYWEIYHLMGDPSLMPYIGVPTPLVVSHAAASPVGITNFTVNTEENAYVAISMNGVLLDAKLADATGVVNLSFPAISNVGVADIVITKQFKEPYIGAVQIISPNGPYVIYASNTITDVNGNNNSLADYNELVDMSIDLHNVGSNNATSVNVVITSNDPYVTLINNTVNVPIINASQIATLPAPFSFQVSFFVPDQHPASFLLTMTDNLGNSWNSNLTVIINAPVLDETNFAVDDAVLGNNNGVLDAGETLDLIVDVTNVGHADIANLSADLSCLSSFVTVNSSSINVPILAVNGQQSINFNITIDPNTPVGTLAQFPFDLTDGFYSYSNTFSQTIGIIDEDYETGDFTQFAWVNDIDYPWTIDNVNVYEGVNSTKSGSSLPDGEVSHLDINVDVTAPGQVSFYKFVSSEQDYDFLQFYIDGNKQGEWSGIDNAWSFVSFPVSVGNHDFEWEYDKDGAVSDGQDCAWLDYIVFPPIDLGLSTNVNIEDFDFELFPNPSFGSFNLTYNDDKQHDIEIYDAKGKLIRKMNNQVVKSSLDMSSYSAGNYTIKVMPESITYQIVKQ
ncbi:MAG: C25 family cysteine peptidase [Flavobacteriales bacterium]|nr:C25 family cysteine peptidase [Flavobacteriales bacterium]MDG1934693.1 C25 family cysteine peptidase [Flavobacteriales bacterium]